VISYASSLPVFDVTVLVFSAIKPKEVKSRSAVARQAHVGSLAYFVLATMANATVLTIDALPQSFHRLISAFLSTNAAQVEMSPARLLARSHCFFTYSSTVTCNQYLLVGKKALSVATCYRSTKIVEINLIVEPDPDVSAWNREYE
jgi:hypothetical protein